MAENTRTATFPEPEFSSSVELREFCNDARKAMHAMAMLAHLSASEIEAVLTTIPDPEGGMFAKVRQKRRARRVAKHLRYTAECLVSGSAGAVRCWNAFRMEYAQELTPVRGRKPKFKVVPE